MKEHGKEGTRNLIQHRHNGSLGGVSAAKEAHELLSGRIVDLYAGGPSTGTAGAEMIGLFLEAEDQLEREPGEALEKIERASALIERLECRRDADQDGGRS